MVGQVVQWIMGIILVERGVIVSGEMLARVLPQMTARVQATGIADPDLRRLYAAMYQAFRRRRSLLLLNLESQVKMEELPWVAALEPFRGSSLSIRELVKQTLTEVTALAITSFPQAILPNKLLQELRALAQRAHLDLPLVDEVAADIFMGRFSGKYLQAAQRAADVIEGSLYATYYGIYPDVVRRIRVGRQRKGRSPRRHPSVDPFAQLCSSRAGVTYKGWNPAINGMIIEQQQILTTQNLAVLFAALDLTTTLQGQLADLAQRCFAWICRRLQFKADSWHAGLIAVKNAAYAWRQMIFFLSLLPEDEMQGFLAWAEAHLGAQRADFQSRFAPALRGLALAAEGRSLDGWGAKRQQAKRFLGWSNKGHWLLGS